MKKFTIITLQEYEPLLLEAIGRSGLAHLIEVKGPDFERLRIAGEKKVDYSGLRGRLNASCRALIESETFEKMGFTPSMADLRELGENPENVVNEVIGKLEDGRKRLEGARNSLEETMPKLIEMRARLEALRALEPGELKKCLAVGFLRLRPLEGQEFTGVSRIEEHLRRFEDVTYKVVEVSPEEGFLFVFGPEGRRAWVESIFLVFDVKDIFNVLSVRDVLLALDAEKRGETLKGYEDEVNILQKFVEGEGEIQSVKDELVQVIVRAEFIDQFLGILSDEEVPVFRSGLVSVLRGWVPTDKMSQFNQVIDEVEKKTGESFIVQFEDPSHEDVMPTPRPTLKPSFFDPAFTLTSLRGWPSAHEINPSLITILVFSLQFGIMFGDVGQGAIFLLLGLILSRKYKRGLMSKLAAMFVPMGIIAIIFGFFYDSVFLIEGILHTEKILHAYPILEHLLSPVLIHPLLENMGKLFRFVLGIAVLEMSLGLVIGSINAVKEGHIWGVLGEHGAGAILFLVGLYVGALYFLQVRDFFAVMSHWSFMIMMAGLILAAIEPVITAVSRKHLGAEVMGESIGGLMMTFVECLGNFFSFLRIGAFALAHACLAIAAHELTPFMGVGGIVLMNVIAMTFEFVSSSVQSLRLLYYEFMGKFFQGRGIPYAPFKLSNQIKKPS